ncbi:MAG: DUF924 family protein [Hyphomicrobiaceae bacterium]
MAGDGQEVRWVGQVLKFWFDELGPQDWFRKNSAVDDEISLHFSDLVDEVFETPVDDLLIGTRHALASVITLDQFPRNLYRGTAKSFAFDHVARKIALKAIALKLDQNLNVHQRVFLYLPFEHSEDALDQERSVELISALGNDGYTGYALKHKAVIDRFGRFPHRNKALGRPTTPEEEAYLAEPGSGF